MARLSYLEKSDLAPEHQDLLARNINLFRAMAHSPQGARAFHGLGAGQAGLDVQQVSGLAVRVADLAECARLAAESIRAAPHFTHETGYVHHQRDTDADRWVDRSFWAADDPEKLGTSNTGYGANLTGTVCGELATPMDELGDAPVSGSVALTS